MPLNLVENIRRHGFKRLLLAVSGGLDSICLAHYFIKNRKVLGIEWLGIAHVHHGLREGTADRDAKFVEEFAKSHDVPFFLKKLDGEALKSAEGSLEENARYARYKALVEIALDPSTSLRFAQDDRGRFPLTSTSLSTGSGGNDKEEGRCPLGVGHDKGPSASLHSAQDDISLVSRLSSLVSYNPIAIVTAHHANDQAETMYMRLKRGTTLAGLRGIQEARILSNSQGVAGGQHLGACTLVRMATKVGLASEAPLEGVMKDRATGCNQGDTSPTHRFENDCSRMTVEEDDSGRFPLTSTSLSTGSGGNDKAETNSLPSTSDRLLPTVSLYRPFLNVTRNELLAYARENDLSWCEDESNADVKFARNKIRHEFLPNLEQECPGTIQQLCKIAGLADRAYAKVIAKCSRSFDFAQDDTRGFPLTSASPQDDKWRSRNRVRDDNAHSALPQDDTSLVSRLSSFVSLDKKKLNKILREYADADLSEMFRLWLTEKGFRFPIGFFYGPKEPAHVKIPVRAVYRRRSVVKIAHTVWICEFKDALSAAKFVSCEKKEKDYNESTKEASSV